MNPRHAGGVPLLLLGWLVVGRPVDAPAQAASPAATAQPGTVRDGQHDFDFEFGTWKAHLKRLLHPLSGSTTWVEVDGISTVRKVWDGRANLGEIAFETPTGRLEGLSLRLYNPETHQWSIRWANRGDGALGIPMMGEFKDGRGLFYDQEDFQGRAIYVRFIFSEITSTTFRLEQAFSADGGMTWEPNWLVSFVKQ